MKAKILALLSSLKSEIVDTWEHTKVYILGALALLFALKFRALIIDFIVRMGQREMKKTIVQDQTLATQEKTDNDQANVLVQEAQNLPSKEKPVADDWYETEGNK